MGKRLWVIRLVGGSAGSMKGGSEMHSRRRSWSIGIWLHVSEIVPRGL